MSSGPRHHAALPKGSRLHWYQIESVLGQGGFGITYLASDTNLNQRVAIKEFLPTDLPVRTHDSSVQPMSDDHADTFVWGLSRFITEAQTLAQFHHPNIVPVHTVFEENNTTYMVMGYVEGQTLEESLKFRRIQSEQQLKAILFALLEGLEKVHEAGFIHRDIKPENIYLQTDGTPVLLDFGSARQALGVETQTLTALVSPGYAPYEQYDSSRETGKQGPWTDIYSLGAVMYRAVTGRAPLDSTARVNAVLDGADTLISASEAATGEYSSGFLHAIDTALRFRPASRPQSVAAWRAEFADVDHVEREANTIVAESPVRPSGRSPRARIGLWLGLVGMVFLGIILTPSLNDLFQQLTSSVEVREGTGEDVSADSPSSSLSGESTGGTEDVDEVSSGEEQLASAEAEAQLLAAVEAEAERVAAAKTEAERLAAAKAEAERLAAAKAEAERLAAAKAEAERLTVANAEAERLAAVKAEAERLAAAKAEAARLEEERILEIGRLLTAARDAIDARRLTSPPGNNALEKINQVLTLDPDNHEVVALRSSIVDKYVELAHSALNDAEIETAKIYVIRAEGVEPEDQGINEIIARIATEEARIAQEAAAELKRRQLEEERAKRQREELNKLAKIESEMLGVSAGCFNMEVIAGGFQRVCVDGFFIGKYEVTFEQFDWYVKETGGAYPEDQGWGRGKRPVIKVSIAEAIAFAKWLSSKTGRTYRLPTEVEWEYAARAGIPAAYPWGVNVGDNLANCADCGSQWDKRMTAPVGSFGANPWGLYDTVGNVWEWTCSRYQPLPTGSERLCARDNETRSLNS